MNGFFITGTDTDAGKTFASSALIRALVNGGLSVAGLKPMASGFDLVDGRWINCDVDVLTKASNVELPGERVNRYAFKPAIAPHIAAQQSGVSLDFDLISDDVPVTIPLYSAILKPSIELVVVNIIFLFSFICIWQSKIVTSILLSWLSYHVEI